MEGGGEEVVRRLEGGGEEVGRRWGGKTQNHIIGIQTNFIIRGGAPVTIL